MEESLSKPSYLSLYNDLSKIKSKIEELNLSHGELESILKESLLINKEILNKETFAIVKKTEQQILNELTDEVIPKVIKNM